MLPSVPSLIASAGDILRLAIFLAFLGLGLWAGRSPARFRKNLFIGFTVGLAMLVGATQTEVWPFTNWALVHTVARASMTIWVLEALDASGRPTAIDHRALQPLAVEELQTWLRHYFLRLTPEEQRIVSRYLLHGAEQARRRFLAGRRVGVNEKYLGPLTAPYHFQRPRQWRSWADVPGAPFMSLRIVQRHWHVDQPSVIRTEIVFTDQ